MAVTGPATRNFSAFQMKRTASGFSHEREEFVAKKIGHDLARTNYDVDRSRRSGGGFEQETPDPRPVVAPAQVRTDSAVLGM